MKENHKNVYELKAVADGRAVALESVGDRIFAEKVLGDGIAVIPDNGRIVSPVSGTVVQISGQKHLYCIRTAEGTNILVHIGLGTVKLDGKGFASLVDTGDTVEAGTPLAQVDLAVLKENGYDTCIPVIVSGQEVLEEKSCRLGEIKAGASVMMEYTLK